MKKFVDDRMFLQTKITLIICQNKNTFTTRTNGGFIQALSTLERSQQEAGEEPHVPTCSYKHKQWELAQSSSSTWWNWQDSWLFSKNSESQEGGKQCLENGRGNPLLIVLWRKPPKITFKNATHFLTDGSFTADGGLL